VSTKIPPHYVNMKCIKCNAPNPKQWFYCKKCGSRASKPIYTTNMFMQSEIGKRSDIEFSEVSMDSHINKLNKDKRSKSQKFWNEKVRQAGAV